MIEIGIAYPKDPVYEDISRFAREAYLKRLDSITAASPDVFAYATCENIGIVGCLGLNRGDTHEELFFEMCKPRNTFERLAGTINPDRALLGELGTRVVAFPKDMRTQSAVASIAMSAAIICTAHEAGIRYIGFVTNTMIRKVAKTLGLNLITLGEPDYSDKSPAFQENMRGFLHVRQVCAGLVIGSLKGCGDVIADLEQNGIITCRSLTFLNPPYSRQKTYRHGE